jgi:hypothetical protein
VLIASSMMLFSKRVPLVAPMRRLAAVGSLIVSTDLMSGGY